MVGAMTIVDGKEKLVKTADTMEELENNLGPIWKQAYTEFIELQPARAYVPTAGEGLYSVLIPATTTVQSKMEWYRRYLERKSSASSSD